MCNINSGITEFQCLKITKRIKKLTIHLLRNKKDFQTNKGLKNMVVKRRRLLKYLSRDKTRYNVLIKKLQLKKI